MFVQVEEEKEILIVECTEILGTQVQAVEEKRYQQERFQEELEENPLLLGSHL